MNRVAVVGCIGAGKSTVARALGKSLCLEVVHLDRLWWRPGHYCVTGRGAVAGNTIEHIRAVPPEFDGDELRRRAGAAGEVYYPELLAGTMDLDAFRRTQGTPECGLPTGGVPGSLPRRKRARARSMLPPPLRARAYRCRCPTPSRKWLRRDMTADYRPEDHYSESVGRVYEAAGVSRGPMSADAVFDVAAECGVSDGSLVLDIGCANGFSTRKLQTRTGCTIEGVDLVESLVRMGRAETEAAGLQDRVSIRQGTILDIPFPDGHFDFVFCRDMLSINEDLPRAVSECERVLRPGGLMLVYVTLATERLSADEADEFRRHLGCLSLDRDVLEACLGAAFAVDRRIVVGSQGVQQRVEGGDDEAIRNLVKVARLETWRDEYVAEFGRRSYEIALADLRWQPYMLLGKLQGLIYVLRKEN